MHLKRKFPCDRTIHNSDGTLSIQDEKEAEPDMKVSEDNHETEIVSEMRSARGGGGRIRLPGVPAPTQLIPLQDFDPECLRELAALANKEDVEIVLERLTIKPLKRRRAEDAVKLMQMADYADSLQCLNQDLNTAAANIIAKFHSDPARPQLHIMHMGDLSRKTVKMYSRPRVTDESKWLTIPKEPALTTLSEHASAIITYMIELASRKLQFKFCDQEKVVCFCLRDADQKKNLIIVNEDDFEGENHSFLKAIGHEPKLKVMFYDGAMSEIVPGFPYTDKAIVELGGLIEQKTEEVIEQLKTLAFKETDVISFLERNRKLITT